MPTQTQAKTDLRNIIRLDPKAQNKELEKLLGVLKKSPPELNNSLGDEQENNESKTSGKSQRLASGGGDAGQTEAEVGCLQQFSQMYASERQLSSHPQHASLSHIFSTLVKTRLNNTTWMKSSPGAHLYQLLVCLNIYLRDPWYQRQFAELDAVPALAQHLERQAQSYLGHGDVSCLVVILKKTANIIQKLVGVDRLRSLLVSAGVHRSLVLLLNGGDIDVLHSAFYTLTNMVQHPNSSEARAQVAQLSCIEILLRILQDYDIMSKKLAAELLRYLVIDSNARERVKVYDGIPILLNQLHSNSPRLLRRVVWCLIYMCGDEESSNDIRLLGGIPLLLTLLHEKKLISERAITENGGVSRKGSAEEELRNLKRMTSYNEQTAEKEEDLREYSQKLRVAVCTCLTELVVSDTNAHHVVQSNGIYSLALLLLPPAQPEENPSDLQANAFRALRFLFSLERNRRFFKRLFTGQLFEKFIDVGHYKREMKCYEPLVRMMKEMEEKERCTMYENIQALNQLREPSHYVGDYAVLEHLGTGAFGTVYKVKKRTAGNSYLALKEININQTVFGKNQSECVQAAGDIMNELNVIKEQLKHPNVVKYKETFPKNDKLYIVMELIEGAPLSEHFHSLTEKRQRFSEERIWKIFIQITLGLRYLHKEKGIVHRDLTPNNVMLGENDKVTITDFGAAKLKPKDCSHMNTIVGTIVYSSPEVIQNQAYNDKVDVWAAGCILYEMCTLQAPFFSKNIMALVKMIVAGKYTAISEDYSPLLSSTIDKCVTVDPAARPDIVQVAGHISERILCHMDTQGHEQLVLERKLEKERKKTQEYYRETAENREKYHKLSAITKERYEKIVNLESSGGGASIKDGCQSDSGGCGGGPSSLDSCSVFSDTESLPLRFPRTRSNGLSHHYHLSEGLSSDDSSAYSPCVQTQRPHWFQSDEDSLSSGSESREGSAGARRRGGMPPLAPRPPTGKDGNYMRRQTKVVENSQPLDVNQQLNVDVGFVSRDSGIVSDEPSPNGSCVDQPTGAVNHMVKGRGHMCRSLSTSSIPLSKSNKQRLRPSAKVSKLTISPDRVRQISDPIQDMLHQLHKIIYICQLPPTLSHDPKRRVIERFKRALFAPPPQSSSVNLKTELHKLVTMSRDQIDLNLGHGDSQKLTKLVSIEHNANAEGGGTGRSVYDTDGEEGGATYERMHAMIETVLQESGYYNATQNNQQNGFSRIS